MQEKSEKITTSPYPHIYIITVLMCSDSKQTVHERLKRTESSKPRDLSSSKKITSCTFEEIRNIFIKVAQNRTNLPPHISLNDDSHVFIKQVYFVAACLVWEDPADVYAWLRFLGISTINEAELGLNSIHFEEACLNVRYIADMLQCNPTIDFFKIYKYMGAWREGRKQSNTKDTSLYAESSFPRIQKLLNVVASDEIGPLAKFVLALKSTDHVDSDYSIVAKTTQFSPTFFHAQTTLIHQYLAQLNKIDSLIRTRLLASVHARSYDVSAKKAIEQTSISSMVPHLLDDDNKGPKLQDEALPTTLVTQVHSEQPSSSRPLKRSITTSDHDLSPWSKVMKGKTNFHHLPMDVVRTLDFGIDELNIDGEQPVLEDEPSELFTDDEFLFPYDSLHDNLSP